MAEAANVLLRKQRRGELSPPELREMLQAVMSLPIRFFEHAPLLLPACTLAETHGLTAYGALYLALAEQRGAHLVTSDDALRNAAKNIGLA